MADGVFNIAKGRVNEYQNRVASNDGVNSALIVVVLQNVESDGVLEDYDDLAAIIGAPGNTEATFTNYQRKVLTDADVSSPIPDDTNNWQSADIPDQTWTAAGGATNNTTAKLIICYDSNNPSNPDANIIPLTYHDFVTTTDGNDLTAQINPAGYYRAA